MRPITNSNYRVKCKECEQDFWASRSDARYCSPNCRKSASRRKEQIERSADNAVSQIISIQRQALKSSDLATVINEALARIERSLAVARSEATKQQPDQAQAVTLATVTAKPICSRCHTDFNMWDSDLKLHWCFECEDYVSEGKSHEDH